MILGCVLEGKEGAKEFMAIFMEGLEDNLGWILWIGFISQCEWKNFWITRDDTEGSKGW